MTEGDDSIYEVIIKLFHGVCVLKESVSSFRHICL
jgi:hypothetical protein